MKQSVLASIALLGTSALALGTGSAVVINSCTYDVHLCNVPAEGGGYEEIDDILSPGAKYTQEWTQLSNGNGWSIKLSKSAQLSNIMQYEYTFHNDGIIWYDLSDVDGNPWNGNWEIISDGLLCIPKQQAYRYSTDDAYGMQACSADSTITVILCSGEDQSNATVSSISSSVVAASSSVWSTSSFSTPFVSVPTFTTTEVSTTPAAAASPTSTSSKTWTQIPSYTHGGHGGPGQANYNANYQEASSTTLTSATTFATSTTAAVEEAPGVTILQVETAVVTDVVTAIYTAPSRVKRHDHHANHHHEA